MKQILTWAACLLLVSSSVVAQETEPVIEGVAESVVQTPVVEALEIGDAPAVAPTQEVIAVKEMAAEVPVASQEATIPVETQLPESVQDAAEAIVAPQEDLDVDSQSSPSDLIPKEEMMSKDEDSEMTFDNAPEATPEFNSIEGSIVDGPIIEPSTNTGGIIAGSVVAGGFSGGLASDCISCAPGIAPPMTMDFVVAAPAQIYDAGACSCNAGCSTGCNSGNDGCNSPCPTSSCGSHNSGGCSSCGSSSGCGCSGSGRRGLRGRLGAPCPGKCGCEGGGLFSRLRHRLSGDRCRR